MKSSKLIFTLLVLFVSFVASADDEPERFQVKRRETKSHFLLTPMGVGTYSTQEDKDLMPGNDSFGFFYKSIDEKRGICRLRMKVVCDYGLEILKELKNIDIKIQFTNIYYTDKSDLEGVVDAIFRCDAHRPNDSVVVTARKHLHSSKLSEFPKELRIPADDCK